MRAMVPGVKLLDGQIVYADELDPDVHEILRAVGGDVGVVGKEIRFFQELRIARPDENPLLTLDLRRAQLLLADRAHIVAHHDQPSRADQALERNLVYRLPVVEEMTARVG